jgi:hypothetical protein
MKNHTEVTVAYVALEHVEEFALSEKRNETRRQAKVVALKVRSVATGGFLIAPVEDVFLGNFAIRGVTPAVSASSDASVPQLEEFDRLEITFELVQNLAILSTREKKLVLAGINDIAVTLPQDATLVAVVPAPAGTFHVTAFDIDTDEQNELGYHINGTVPQDWNGIALRKREAALSEQRRIKNEKESQRRQASERAELEAKAAQMRREAEAMPVEMFETKDREVAAQLRVAYRLQIVQSKRTKDANGQVVFRIEDPDGYGPSIAAAVATKRKELAAQHEDADAYFERQRREADEVLAAR